MVSQSRPYLYARRTAQKRQPPERLAIPVSMTLADFLTAAYKLANDEARELGWIE